MASAVSINNINNETQPQNSTLASFSLLWLDVNRSRISYYLDVRSKIYSTIDSIEDFENVEPCENYVKQAIDQCHHIVIVGKNSGQEFIPRLHPYEQVSTFYIFSVDEDKIENEWIKSYGKVKNVYSNIDDLLEQIIADRKRSHSIGTPLTFTMFHIRDDIEKSSLALNGNFLHLQLLIELLIGLKSNPNDRKKFIDLCQKEYAGKESVLCVIDEFEKTYSPNNAVQWYTRETFVYQQLNKALRLQDINWLFHFRFLIHDMHEILIQMQEQQRTSPFANVYRNQLMSLGEITHLKNSIGSLISFTSFLSTSRDRQSRLNLFGDDPTVFTDLQPVLFEIVPDESMNNHSNLVFADITEMSVFKNVEQETLFMIGSMFRLEQTYMENFVTVFKLIPCSKSDVSVFNRLVDEMKCEIGIGSDETLLTLGTLLWKSGRYEQAEQFYHQMLEQIQLNDDAIPCCYQGLGFVAAARGDLDSGLMWQRKALEYYQHILIPNHYRFGCIWNTIGNLYWRDKKYDLALEAYDKAKIIFGEHYDRDLASCLNNIGNIYEETGQLEIALKYHLNAMEIRESILPPNHSELGMSHHNIANVYCGLGRLDCAQTHIKQALKIFEKSLRSNDPSIATTYQTMAAIEFKRGACRQGLKYLERAAVIFSETLPINHPTITSIHTELIRVMKAMNEHGYEFL